MDEAFIELCRYRVRIERYRLKCQQVLDDLMFERRDDMASLAEVAARIAAKKAAHAAKADEMMGRLDGIDQKEPEVFARADAVMNKHEGDLDKFDNDLRQLSNLYEDEPRSSDIAHKQGNGR